MADVVNLKDVRTEVVLVCDCGCVTYQYCKGGMLRCAACREYMRADATSWVEENEPPADKVIESKPNHISVIDLNDHVAALKRVAATAIEKHDELVLLLVCYAGGEVKFWNSVAVSEDDEKRKEWFRQRMEIVIKESVPDDERN